MVPASRGLAWLITAANLLRQQTWRLLTVAVLVQLAMTLTRLPVIGLIVALGLPILTAGMLHCFDQVRRGLPLSPVALFAPLGNRRLAMRLFLLGGLIGLIAIILISWLLSGIQELQDPELLARIEQGDIEAVLALDPAVVQRAFFAIVIGVSVSGTLGYFSVPLIWFGEMRMGQAITTGIKALVKNWLAFLLLGVILVALSLPIFLVLGLLMGVTAVAGGPGIIQYVLILFAVLLIQLLMFGTQYCAYAEIFELGDGEGNGPVDDSEAREDQFVA